jgi:hypothetical protein
MSPAIISMSIAFSAGAILVMLGESMIPEAFKEEGIGKGTALLTNLPFVTSNPILGGTTGLGTDYLAPAAGPRSAPSLAAAPMPPAAPTLAGMACISYS